MTLEKQSKLVIYIDQANTPHIEVVTKFPSKAFLDYSSPKFSGFLTKDNWDGSRIQTIKYENGRALLRVLIVIQGIPLQFVQTLKHVGTSHIMNVLKLPLLMFLVVN